MFFVRFIRSFPLLTLAAVFWSGICSAADPNSFTLYLTTNAENRYGGNVVINVGSMTVDELPRFVQPTSDVREARKALLPSVSEPIEVVIVVPKGAAEDVRAGFIRQIRTAMARKYPNAVFNIRESFVDTQADRAALEEQRAELNDLRAGIVPASPQSPEALRLADKINDSIDAGLEENRRFERSWVKKAAGGLNETHPYNTVIAARVVALTKLATSGFVLISKYGINAMSLVIGGISGGISAAFGYNAKKWSEFCTTHQFPWFKDALPVKLYNKTGWFKSATINLVRSLGLSYMLRELAYLSNQQVKGERVGSPNSLNFFVEGLGLTIPEIVLDGLVDDGVRALELKGVLNHQSRSYVLWTIGLIDTAMHSFFRAGAVKAAYTVAAISWGSKLAVWGASKLLKPVQKRFIFISDGVSSEKTGEIVENRGNFLAYLASLGKGIFQGVANRRAGKFSVSDKEMVLQQLGLSEAWNLALSPAEVDRIKNDASLTQAEFEKMLNLRDTDREIVNSMWKNRERQLGQSLRLLDMCEAALTGN